MSKAISDTVTKNGVLKVFCMKTAQCNKKQGKSHLARNNFALFSRLSISCQTGKEIWNTFLVMKTKLILPLYQKIRVFDQKKRKSSIIGCTLLEEFTSSNEGANVSTKIFDVAAIIIMLVPTNCKNFLQYAHEESIPYTRSQVVDIQRIDLVCDHYFQDSLKS